MLLKIVLPLQINNDFIFFHNDNGTEITLSMQRVSKHNRYSYRSIYMEYIYINERQQIVNESL